MSSYFTLPSFARARKNQEALRKSNPQIPVLNAEDERFLKQHISQDTRSPAEHGEVTKITDKGERQPASPEEQKAAEGDPIVPETQPKSPASPARPGRKKDIELPSQEQAEATTRSWNSAVRLDADKSADKRTWVSYLPTTIRPPSTKKVGAADHRPESAEHRTWTEYAASYVPTRDSIPTWLDPSTWTSKDEDAKLEPVFNDDGSVNEEKTKEKQEKEVSVLLDNLNMSTVNNRVFSFSEETHKYYDRFAQCLKDTMNGLPTAYDDMDKLMRDAGPTLESQFKSMPTFIQTLVKSLPAKLGASLGPELLAAASEKPGADAKELGEVGKKSLDHSMGPPKPDEKTKRRMPGMKKLVGQQGVVATMLRNTVNFLTTRFPFLASATNVVMSLAVFILMFVFWYCHKRGREARLAKEAEASFTAVACEAEGEDDDIEVSDSEDNDEPAQKLEKALNQPDPAEVPLPRAESELDPQ